MFKIFSRYVKLCLGTISFSSQPGSCYPFCVPKWVALSSYRTIRRQTNSWSVKSRTDQLTD